MIYQVMSITMKGLKMEEEFHWKGLTQTKTKHRLLNRNITMKTMSIWKCHWRRSLPVPVTTFVLLLESLPSFSPLCSRYWKMHLLSQSSDKVIISNKHIMHYERFYLQTAVCRCPHPAISSGELVDVLTGCPSWSPCCCPDTSGCSSPSLWSGGCY